MKRIALVAVALALIASAVLLGREGDREEGGVLSATVTATATATAIPQRFFAPDSVWNKPLPADAPLDPSSKPVVASLLAQIDQAVRTRFGPTINWYEYSVPIYSVGARQRKVRVFLDNPATYADTLRAALERVPVPRRAKAAAGNDQHMLIWQKSTDTLWEFWKMHRERDGWHAKSGGRMEGVSRNPGYFAGPAGYPWGATATSLPLAGGLILPGELKAGRIRHALAFAIPRTRGSKWSFPAQRTDGFIYDRRAVPHGARFRLNRRFDVSKLKASRTVKVLARAAQRYGIIVRDTSATPVFYAQDPVTFKRNPYRRLFGSEPLYDQLARFPWDQLQLTKMDLRGYRIGK